MTDDELKEELKKLRDSEPFSEWEDRTGEIWSDEVLEKIRMKITQHRNIRKQRKKKVIGILTAVAGCALILVCALLPVFLRESAEPPLKQYGEFDLTKTECSKETFLNVSPLNLDGIEEILFKKGNITETDQLGLVSMKGVLDHDLLYAELDLNVVLMKNLTISKHSTFQKCDSPCSVGDFDFVYCIDGRNDVFVTYLAYAENANRRYYLTVNALEETNFVRILESLFLAEETVFES